MRGFKSIFVSSKHKIKCLHEKYFQTTNAVDTLPLTRALLGGGAFERPPPPLRFFEDSEKTAARSAAGFSPTLPPSFPQLL